MQSNTVVGVLSAQGNFNADGFFDLLLGHFGFFFFVNHIVRNSFLEVFDGKVFNFHDIIKWSFFDWRFFRYIHWFINFFWSILYITDPLVCFHSLWFNFIVHNLRIGFVNVNRRSFHCCRQQNGNAKHEY